MWAACTVASIVDNMRAQLIREEIDTTATNHWRRRRNTHTHTHKTVLKIFQLWVCANPENIHMDICDGSDDIIPFRCHANFHSNKLNIYIHTRSYELLVPVHGCVLSECATSIDIYIIAYSWKGENPVEIQ